MMVCHAVWCTVHWSDDSTDPKGKKRKADPSISKAAPPSKRPAVSAPGTSIKTVAVKKDVKTVVREVKDAKSDSSFFSAPKPKPKLPSFKKASPASTAVKKEPDHNVAQPSSINPFEEALKSMAKTRRDSPATSTPPPPVPSSSAPSAAPSLTVSGKPKKMVTWAPEGKLELIKLIERAVYDDDPADVSAISLVLSYVQYINCRHRCLAHRARSRTIMSAISIETKVLRYTPTCSRNKWSGQNLFVSHPQRCRWCCINEVLRSA